MPSHAKPIWQSEYWIHVNRDGQTTMLYDFGSNVNAVRRIADGKENIRDKTFDERSSFSSSSDRM
jgi:hypothetical protein